MALRLWCGVGHDQKLPSEFSGAAQGAAQANAIFAWRKSERERSHMATQLEVAECGSRLQRENRVQSSQVRALRTSPVRKRQPPLQGGGTCGKQEPEVHNLLLAMAPLVKRIAFEMRQHLPTHVEMDDLVSAGSLGLVDALRKFDPARKVKIESYARHRIRGASWTLCEVSTLPRATCGGEPERWREHITSWKRSWVARSKMKKLPQH